MSEQSRVLYVIVCAAGPAPEVGRLVKAAQAEGWDVWLVPTPSAVEFLDVPALEELTEHPIRARYRKPGEAGKLPPADAVIVAPATYNTINKWAAGIADTFGLGLLAELTPSGIPIAVLPFVNASLAANRVFSRSVAELRESGVTVLLGEGAFVPHPAGTGGERIEGFGWGLALEAVSPPIDEASEAEYERVWNEYRLETLATIRRLTKEIRYSAPRFSQMITDHGAVEASKQLLRSSNVATGFETLQQHGRLSDSVEAAVLKPRYEILFSEEERETARRRLIDVGFDVEGYLRGLGEDS